MLRCPSWAFGEPSWTCYTPLTTHHSSPGVTVSILGIRRAKLDVLHATDRPSQQSRRYGVLPGHSASQAGCASRHATPITVVQAVRCPSRAFGEPIRILLHNPHVTAVPVVNWQRQDEMRCPVCCSLVTGCCLGQGWAFLCAGAFFIMFHYDQLSQQERADALLPAHVFPVTGFGTLPETGEKVLSTKLVAARKDIHGVPAASAVVTSSAMSWPMLNGTLPATSLSTFRLSSAGLYVTTWSELVVLLQGVSLSSTAGGVAPACLAWCRAAPGNGSVCARATSGTAAGRPVHVASAVL